ncbi:MAG: thioredoxin fold domain-containing protein, partial [Bacteroidota bacterium]
MMMSRFFYLLLFVSSATWQGQAQGIDFFHGTWQEALALAKTQDKIIFVDAFTTWCGPCKRMAKQVFPDQQVGAFYNKNFISMKIDMEKEEGLAFQRKYPVSAYPTLYYIDGDGKVVHKTKGGRQVAQFIELGKTAMSKNDKSGQYAEAYESGDRDPTLIYNYVKALNKANKPSLKISNDYLNSQKDLTTEHNLRFILEAAVEADSRIFTLLTKYRPQIEALHSAEAVNERIENACTRTVGKAIQYQMVELLEEAKEKMNAHYPEKAEAFAVAHEMRYYQATKDAKNFIKACQTFVKKEAKNNPELLHKVANELFRNFSSS